MRTNNGYAQGLSLVPYPSRHSRKPRESAGNVGEPYGFFTRNPAETD
jgi:hypothetical protein